MHHATEGLYAYTGGLYISVYLYLDIVFIFVRV